MSALVAYKKPTMRKSSKKRTYSQSKSISTSTVARLVKKSMLSTIETKAVTRQYTGSLTVPEFLLLNPIAVGAGYTQAVGSKVQPHGLNVRCSVVPLTATTGVQTFRLLIVLDRQCNGSTPVLNQILRYPETDDPAFAGREYDHIQRFRVLSDEFVTIGHSLQNGQFAFQKYYDLSKLSTQQLTGSTGTISDIGTNSIHAILVPSNQALFSFGTTDPEYCIASIYTYKDV